MFAPARLAAQAGLYLALGALYGVAHTVLDGGDPSLSAAVAAVDVQFLVPTAAALLGVWVRPPTAPGRPWRAAFACAAAFSLVLALAWLATAAAGAVPGDRALRAAAFGGLRAGVAAVFGTLIGAQLRQPPAPPAGPPR